MAAEKLRRCTICGERFGLSAANFALTKKGFAYVCCGCKTLDNAIRYRRKKLERTDVLPFAEQERKIILHAIGVCYGSVPRAARLLKIGRATLYRKVDQYRAEGTFQLIEQEAMSMLRVELAELEERWTQLRRKGFAIRRKEATKAVFNKLLDDTIADVQRERAVREAAALRASQNG